MVVSCSPVAEGLILKWHACPLLYLGRHWGDYVAGCCLLSPHGRIPIVCASLLSCHHHFCHTWLSTQIAREVGLSPAVASPSFFHRISISSQSPEALLCRAGQFFPRQQKLNPSNPLHRPSFSDFQVASPSQGACRLNGHPA